MLYKIAIENFYSIAERQELVFEIPKNAPDLECFKVSRSDGVTRLPTVVGFFGPNASGKSTVLRSVVSLTMFACDSFNWTDEIDFFFQAYRQQDWWGKPTKIMVEFDCQLSPDAPSALFRYELHVTHKVKSFVGKTIAYEALFYAPKGKFRCLFKRNGQQFDFGPEFNISNTNDSRKESIRSNASVISTLEKFNHPVSTHLKSLIKTLGSNIVSVNKIIPTNNQLLSVYENNKPCLDQLNRELRRLDVGLESMTLERGNQGLFAKFKHVGLDEIIFLHEESGGTQRFIEIFARLYHSLAMGSVVIIDELDTEFHPLLLSELLRWFNDSERNPHGAQLLCTGHNPVLLDNLEKEQVFFTEKPLGQSTRIYGARDIKGLRREPSLMKKYLAGELGAVPHIG